MNKSICCVFDEVSGQFSNVLSEDNCEFAKRAFTSSVWKAQVEEDGLFWTNPSDFALYHIGDFDTETGELVAVVPIVRLMNAGEAVFEYQRWKESEEF